MRRLNGWQRFWVVIAGLHSVIVLALSSSLWPPTEEIFSMLDRADQLVTANPSLREVQPLTEQQLAELARDSRVTEADLALLTPDERQRLDRTMEEQQKQRRWAFFGQAMVWWSVPLASLYGLGWLTAWVRRGFVE